MRLSILVREEKGPESRLESPSHLKRGRVVGEMSVVASRTGNGLAAGEERGIAKSNVVRGWEKNQRVQSLASRNGGKQACLERKRR